MTQRNVKVCGSENTHCVYPIKWIKTGSSLIGALIRLVFEHVIRGVLWEPVVKFSFLASGFIFLCSAAGRFKFWKLDELRMEEFLNWRSSVSVGTEKKKKSLNKNLKIVNAQAKVIEDRLHVLSNFECATIQMKAIQLYVSFLFCFFFLYFLSTLVFLILFTGKILNTPVY